MVTTPPDLSDRFANFQQADEVSIRRDDNVVTVEAETKIPYRDFSAEGPLRAIMLSYRELAIRGNACSVSFDSENPDLIKRIRDEIFPGKNIASGENNTTAIEGIRSDEILDKLSEVFSLLRDEGILLEEPPKQSGQFTIPSRSESFFIGSLNRLLEKRDNTAREESYKVGFDPDYEVVKVQLAANASPVWGQELPDLTPLDERPQPKSDVGGYDW